jgi:hypothetical protein
MDRTLPSTQRWDSRTVGLPQITSVENNSRYLQYLQHNIQSHLRAGPRLSLYIRHSLSVADVTVNLCTCYNSTTQAIYSCGLITH